MADDPTKLDAKAGDTPTDPADVKPDAAAVDEKKPDPKKAGADDTAPAKPKKRVGRPRGSRDRAPRARAAAPRKTPRKQRLAEFIGTIAIPLAFVSQPDANVILANAESVATALDNLAKENPQVARVIDGLLTSSAWGGVAFALMPVIVGIGANHGLVPPHVAGVFQMAALLDQEPATTNGAGNDASNPLAAFVAGGGAGSAAPVG